MKAVVIYESLTGNTARLAELIAEQLVATGVSVTAVSPITSVDYEAVSEADIVLVGSWTDGIFVAAQRVGRGGRLGSKLPAIRGKKAAVFVTFALNPGKVVDKLTKVVESRGAEVIGGMAIRRDDLEGGAEDFVGRLLTALESA
jgi:flavorubredoxin